MPATIRWPGILPEGTKTDQMFTVHDWFQTLISAAGVEPGNSKAFDGVDMWLALKDGDAVVRGDTIIGVERSYAVFRDGWKLVEHTPRGTNQTATHLFRIAADPNEEQDLIDFKPDLASELTGALRAMPRAPSVGTDDPPARARRSPGARGAKGKGPRRPRNPAALRGSPEETRAPWLETAIKD